MSGVSGESLLVQLSTCSCRGLEVVLLNGFKAQPCLPQCTEMHMKWQFFVSFYPYFIYYDSQLSLNQL